MSSKRTSTLVMIGGGIQQVPAIDTIQRMGHQVLVVDKNPDAPAFANANYRAVFDGRDVENISAYILEKASDLNIKGIFTLTELVTSCSVASVASNLPHANITSTVSCQNKGLAKKQWLSDNIPTPKGTVVHTIEEAISAFHTLGHDIFTKPCTGFGGAYCAAISSEKHLREYFRTLSNDGVGQALIVEENHPGEMFDVNGLIDHHGNFQALGIIDRFFIRGTSIESGIRTPTKLSIGQQHQLYTLLFEAAKSLGITLGPIKADVVLSKGHFKILEIAPRLHGPRSSLKLLPHSGFFPLQDLVNFFVDPEFRAKDCLPTQPVHALGHALVGQPGRILNIEGLEVAEHLANVVHVDRYKYTGDMISRARDSSAIIAYVFCTGDSADNCRRTMDSAMENIDIKMEDLADQGGTSL